MHCQNDRAVPSVHPIAGGKGTPKQLIAVAVAAVTLACGVSLKHGDLKAARKAFEDSLKLEPGNPTALADLDYIDSLEAKRP